MKFLTEDEASNYYNRPFDQISPTYQPQDHYMVGQDTFKCPECNEQLDTECNEAHLQQTRGHSTGSGGFVERAYCPNCHIEYKRNRKPVVEEVDYQYKHYRTDEREEYICSDCRQRHPLTTPKDEFQYSTQPTVNSLETVSINCPCGARHNINELRLDSVIDCDNCPRTFKFTVMDD